MVNDEEFEDDIALDDDEWLWRLKMAAAVAFGWFLFGASVATVGGVAVLSSAGVL